MLFTLYIWNVLHIYNTSNAYRIALIYKENELRDLINAVSQQCPQVDSVDPNIAIPKNPHNFDNYYIVIDFLTIVNKD